MDQQIISAKAPADTRQEIASFVAADNLRLRTCRHGRMLFNQHDHFIGRSLDLYGEYCEDEIVLLCRHLRKHYIRSARGAIIDVGANIGTHTVAFGRIGYDVIALEPQLSVRSTLWANISLNGLENNVHVLNQAAGSSFARKFFTPSDSSEDHNSGGVSLSDSGEIAVEVAPLDKIISHPWRDEICLIKIDAEGMEFDVLNGAERLIDSNRPILYIENDRIDKSASILGWLEEHGYDAWWHFAPLYREDNFRQEKQNIFSTYASLNVICFPREKNFTPPDLVKVEDAHDWPSSVTSMDERQLAAFKHAQELNQVAGYLRSKRNYAVGDILVRRALDILPNNPSLLSHRGALLWNMARYTEAERALKKALELAPEDRDARINMQLVLGALRRWGSAEEILNKLIIQEPDIRINRLDQAFLYLGKGDWNKGLEAFEVRMDCAEFGVQFQKLKYPMWKGEDLTGKTLFVQAEQGIGDTILFSRYMHWICTHYENVKVKFVTNPHMVKLLWDFTKLANFEFLPADIPWPEGIDYAIFLASLPLRHGTATDNIYPDPGFINSRVMEQRSRSRYPLPTPSLSGLKVGICWTGNPEQAHNEERSIPALDLLDIAVDSDLTLYSLQVGPGAKVLQENGGSELALDMSAELEKHGLIGCGLVMKELDVVVTVCTSVAHLAGALGIPCFLLLCYNPYWVWLRHGQATGWYPSVRIFRQPKPGDWESVMTEVKSALHTLALKRKE